MKNRPHFEIENLGAVNKACLEIRKVNVVVGKNDSGKSAISKFLFSLFISLSHEGIRLANTDIKNRLFEIIYIMKYTENSKDLTSVEEMLNRPFSNELFEKICEKLPDNTHVKKIEKLIEINKNRDLQFAKTFRWLLNSYYPIENAKITFKDTGITQEILPMKNISKKFFNHFYFENIIYIDSQSPFDLNIENTSYHIKSLREKLKNSKNKGVYDNEFYKKLNKFENSLKEMTKGDFKYEDEKFIFEKNGIEYEMQNTSQGLKHLGILQLLFKNRWLSESSFLILDEPESNLHPEFQLKLAEILVLASKELNITVYLNTYSPFMAEAVEVYAKYHRSYDDVRFYLTEESKNPDKFDFIQIDDEDILDVYNNLGNLYHTLNKVRFETELRDDLGE